jgi:predicted nuclease of predicted toxin-antitoxin system
MHVADLPSGLKLTDSVLWKYAADKDLVVVSKDRDFFERSLVYGMPPQVVFIQVGNCSNDQLIKILGRFWDDVAAAIRNYRPLVMVTRTDVKKY